MHKTSWFERCKSVNQDYMCTDDKYRAPKALSRACVDNKHATERTQVSDALHVHIKTLLCAQQKQSSAGTQSPCVCLKKHAANREACSFWPKVSWPEKGSRRESKPSPELMNMWADHSHGSV